MFVGTKNFSYRICYENIDRITKVKRQAVHGGQTELNNMLVRRNVINEVNKDRTFTQGFKEQENQKESISKFRRPLKLADKVHC